MRWLWIDRIFWAATATAALSGGGMALSTALSLADSRDRLQVSPLSARIAEAAEEELAGNLSDARAILTRLATDDRRFAAAWALAQFHQRNGDHEAYWTAIARAARMSYGDRTALFASLVRAARDSHREPDSVATILPPEAVAAYSAYLVSSGQLEAAARLLDPRDQRLAVTLTERLIASGNLPAALAVWNRADIAPVDPGHPRVVNGDFAFRPWGEAFDWRLGAPDGVTSGVLTSPGTTGQFEVTFSGDQGDRGELLSQWLVLAPKRRYRLHWESKSTDATASPNLQWLIEPLPPRSPVLLAGQTPLRFSSAWTVESAVFTTGPRTNFGRLTLSWHRPIGHMRASGSFAIRNVRLDFAP